MFTSEPSLAQRIERMIGDVPIVDIRAELPADQLHAPDLAALMVAPPLRAVYAGVGMSYADFLAERGPEERVEFFLPFLRQVRNTSAAWCLFRIFRDLYDFDEPHLTLDNYRGLLDRVARDASNPDRARQVICDRARVRRVVAPRPDPSTATVATAPEFLAHRLDIVPTPLGDATPAEVKSGVFDQLDAEIEGTVRFAALDHVPDLANPIYQAVLEWHFLHRAPIQLVIDPFAPPADQLARATALATQYHDVRFGLLNGQARFGSEITTLARNFSNVFTGEYAGWETAPALIEANVFERIQQAGVTKIGGFASGATSAEWIYGAVQATKKATAAALARVVANGFFEEEEIPPLMQAIFADSPTSWYRLAD